MPHTKLSDEFLKECKRTYVDPGFIDANGQHHTLEGAKGHLHKTGAVILVTDPGNGAETSAMRLLAELPGIERKVVYDVPNRILQDTLPTEPRAGYLLSLDTADPKVIEKLSLSFMSYVRTIKDCGSFLVLCLTAEHWRELQAGATELVFTLPRPDSRQVLASRLSAAGISAGPWLGNTSAHRLWADKPPRAVARLAALIVDARKSPSQSEKSDEQITNDVLAAYHNWRDNLEKWFADESNTTEARLFLLATAMLEAEPAPQVVRAAEALAQALGDQSAISSGFFRSGSTHTGNCHRGDHLVRRVCRLRQAGVRPRGTQLRVAGPLILLSAGRLSLDRTASPP
ncbi:hypothetical protein [Fodinicola feengrottensis]|uniref:hypothetical protein n=1 Tax=Fodinicola feengrottensis TaxID=435914 RepID=UPI0013D61179|nr:hypothetical protein [Fodinicola feengrottensis]